MMTITVLVCDVCKARHTVECDDVLFIAKSKLAFDKLHAHAKPAVKTKKASRKKH